MKKTSKNTISAINLINSIKGLGNKHKNLNNEEAACESSDSKPSVKVIPVKPISFTKFRIQQDKNLKNEVIVSKKDVIPSKNKIKGKKTPIILNQDSANQAILDALVDSKVKANWISLMSHLGLYNKEKLTFGLNLMQKTAYGYSCKILIPNGLSYEQLEKSVHYIEDGLGCLLLLKKEKRSSIIDAQFVFIKPSSIPYNVVKTREYEVYIGNRHDDTPIILNLVQLPNLLVSGGVRSGKSKLLDTILTTIIHNTTKREFNLYCCQVAKDDLIIYQDVEQCMAYASDLEETLLVLKDINEEMVRRMKLILPMHREFKGDNAYDYNKLNPENPLPVIFVAFDETSSLFCTIGDDKDTKALKEEIVKYIRRIAQYGGGLYVYYFVSLQRPTRENLDPFVKAMSTIAISLRQNNSRSSEVAIDDPRASLGLRQREFVYRTEGDLEYGVVPLINNNTVYSFIKDKIVPGHGEENSKELKAKIENIKSKAEAEAKSKAEAKAEAKNKGKGPKMDDTNIGASNNTVKTTESTKKKMKKQAKVEEDMFNEYATELNKNFINKEDIEPTTSIFDEEEDSEENDF